MPTIGPVELKVTMAAGGGGGVVDVTYDLEFTSRERSNGTVFSEVCRLMGDDTGVGDGRRAGGDDTLGFLTPLFHDVTPSSRSLHRHFTRSFSQADLDEDRGSTPNPDELRARVVLTPKDVPRPSATLRESNLVTLNLT